MKDNEIIENVDELIRQLEKKLPRGKEILKMLLLNLLWLNQLNL